MFSRAGSNPRSDSKTKNKNPKSPPRGSSNSKYSAPTRNVGVGVRRAKPDLANLLKSGNPTDFLNGAIHEYLLHKELIESLDVFKNEVNKLGVERRSIELNGESQILEAFEKGLREPFFKKWNNFVPVHIRSTDEFCNKLEFYLHLYFVVYNVHPFSKKNLQRNKKHDTSLDKLEVQAFKHYLDTKGPKLAQTTEFVQFYALPYIPNPLTHPSLKDVFTREWLIELKSKLQSFLSEVGSSDNLPVLYQMYSNYVNAINGGAGATAGTTSILAAGQPEQYGKVISQLENSNQSLMNILQEYNEKYEGLAKHCEVLKRNEEIVRNHLFESNVKWINFLKEVIILTNETLQVVDTQKSGAAVSDNIIDILKKKLQTYETFLNSNQEELFNTSQDNSFIEKVSTSHEAGTPDHSTLSHAPNKFQFEDRAAPYVKPYTMLNFEKVKSFLVNKGNSEASLCALVQALGWRITKVQGINMRREVITSYSKNDLLDLHRNEPCVLESVMKSPHRRVKEAAARLVNILTLDYSGRSYLLGSDKLVIMLIDSLKSEEGDTVIRKNSLGALQKLSLRRRPQLLMIEHDMIKWIVTTLKNEKDTLSEYSYEYATALFMNLSLRSLGKKKCEELELEVLKVLNDLLEHENMQVRSFVNGTLYSLLSKTVFKEHAKALGMNEVLSYLMENSDERYRKQIQYILEQLDADKAADDDTQSDTNDEDNDYDDMEDDDDFGEEEYTDDKINNPNVLTGEELLKKHFSLSGPESHQQFNQTIKETLSESRSQTTMRATRLDPHSPLNRPTTPSMLNKMIQQETQNLNIPEGFETRSKISRTPAGVTKEDFYGGHTQQYYQGGTQNSESQKPSSQQQRVQPRPSEKSLAQDFNDTSNPNRSRRQSKRADQIEENRQSFDQHNHSKSSSQSPPKTEKELEREKKQQQFPDEYYAAFESKPKLPRSPEHGDRRR